MGKNDSFLEFSQKASSMADARSLMAFSIAFGKLSGAELCSLEASAIGTSTVESFSVSVVFVHVEASKDLPGAATSLSPSSSSTNPTSGSAETSLASVLSDE